MTSLYAYLPVIGFVLCAMALLFATAADRNIQVARIRASWRRACTIAGVRRALSWQRGVFGVIILLLLSYISTYQRIQDAIAVELVQHNIEGVRIGSLIIPWSAMFQTNYPTDAGFSKSRKRVRADLEISGHLFTGFAAEIDETGLAKVNRVTGRQFVFSYLTDTKILRPVINRHMQQLIKAKQIDQYQIETFDNRGPYLLVVLSPANRQKDIKAIATTLANGLHTNLTQTNQLKVNQVVVKIIAAEPYLADQTIKVIARGTAGNY